MDYAEGESPLKTGDDGIVKITRDEKEVFNPKTMASFEGKPLTITHPKEFVGPENWQELTHGIIQNVRRGKDADTKDDLMCDLLVTDGMAIALIKNGLREVSCGYEAEYEQTGEGTGIQTNIIGNHLALVRKGRAGSSYAINDHQGKGLKMKLPDVIKSIFAKAQDEAMKAAADAEKEPEKEPAKDAGAYDELVKICKDLGSKIDAMKPKDAGADPVVAPPAKDADPMEDRMAKLEAAVQALLEKQASAGDSDPEKEKEDAKDADPEDVEDDDFDESNMTGDSASRAEILSPGIKASKDIKKESLEAAYKTKEGKKVIDSITGGKAPTFDSAEKTDMLFITASELMKAIRNKELSGTKSSKVYDFQSSYEQEMTAEKMNEINSKHYKGAN